MTKEKKTFPKHHKYLLLAIAVSIFVTLSSTFLLSQQMRVVHQDLISFYTETQQLTDEKRAQIAEFQKENELIKVYARSREFSLDNGWKINKDPVTQGITLEKEIERPQEVYEGIGISYKKDNDKFVIISVIEGSPAQKAGLHQGDEIIEVDGISTSNMSKAEINTKIRGEAGSVVKLGYKPAGAINKRIDVDVTRGKIALEQKDKGE